MLSRLFLRFSALVLILLTVAAACETSPPTQYLMEVTREVTVIVVWTPTPEDATPEPTNTVEATAEVTPVIEVQPTLEPTLDPFPAPILEQVIVAEQTFQNGKMFYLQPNQEIWVMINLDDDTDGVWTRHRDIWAEGMPERDPELVPPDEDLQQPIRGFGKLWRENAAVQEALGWAMEPEAGHVTEYAYVAGGEVTAAGEYIPGPGYHTIRSRFGYTYVFDEVDGSWRRVEEENDES